MWFGLVIFTFVGIGLANARKTHSKTKSSVGLKPDSMTIETCSQHCKLDLVKKTHVAIHTKVLA